MLNLININDEHKGLYIKRIKFKNFVVFDQKNGKLNKSLNTIFLIFKYAKKFKYSKFFIGYSSGTNINRVWTLT